MNRVLSNWCIVALMFVAAAVAYVSKPHAMLAEAHKQIDLDRGIPQQFGEWRSLQQSAGQIINPQQTKLLHALYSQILSRAYANPNGGMVMLSIAYGANQGDGLALHYPDLCYPAQGFEVKEKQYAELSTSFGTVPVKRLNTQMGNRREPLTYWSTVGDHVVRGGVEAKLAQLRYGLKGQIPDGLIFRVSSLSGDTDAAYRQQEKFVDELLAAVSPEMRGMFIGNTTAMPAVGVN